MHLTNSQISPPAKKAQLDPLSPAPQVRSYITTLLISEYDVPEDEAERVAEKWRGALGF
jgi:hypothetical protein